MLFRRQDGLNRRAALALVCGGPLAGCFYRPESYPPPEQRPEPAGDFELAPFVRMSDAGALSHFVSDISPSLEAATWRWAFREPKLQFAVGHTEGLKFRMELTFPDVVFSHTGPATLTVKIDGHVLDRVRFDAPGPKVVEKAVPPEWLKTGVEIPVEARLDKVYVAPGDGQALSYILIAAGFVE